MASLLLNFARQWWRTGVTDRRYGTLPKPVKQLSGSGSASSKVECAIYPLRVVPVQLTARIQECTPSKDAVNKALVIDRHNLIGEGLVFKNLHLPTLFRVGQDFSICSINVVNIGN
jgi:hypothetical protein